MKLRIRVLLAYSALSAVTVQAGEPVLTPAERDAVRVIEADFRSVPCGAGFFVYGVGSTDGSHVERILYVGGAGNTPTLQVKWRGAIPEPYDQAVIAPDLPPLPFLLELRVPRALHGTPDGAGWRLAPDGWQTALRFKYTHWYGRIRREDGAWRIEWDGYRRPLLPGSVSDRHASICAMFQGG
jgi:hypothetical protein